MAVCESGYPICFCILISLSSVMHRKFCNNVFAFPIVFGELHKLVFSQSRGSESTEHPIGLCSICDLCGRKHAPQVE